MTYLIAAQGKTQIRWTRSGRGMPGRGGGRVPTGPRHGCDPDRLVTLCGLAVEASGFELFHKEWAGAAGRTSCPHCVAALLRLDAH